MSEPALKLESVWTTVAGRPMHARVSLAAAPPSAPAVVLVHGVGVSSRYLLPTAELLAPHYRTYAPDLPGFGRSARPNHILNIPELADALAAWLYAGGPERATFVGNSMGCQVIVDLAVRYPELVEAAVLVGACVDARARSVLRQIGRGVCDLFREPLSYWPVLIGDYLRAGPIRTLVTLHHAVVDPLVEKLPQVGVPTLVVRGAQDPIAPQRWAEEMSRLLPQKRGRDSWGRPCAELYHPSPLGPPDPHFLRCSMTILQGGEEPSPPLGRLAFKGPSTPAHSARLADPGTMIALSHRGAGETALSRAFLEKEIFGQPGKPAGAAGQEEQSSRRQLYTAKGDQKCPTRQTLNPLR